VYPATKAEADQALLALHRARTSRPTSRRSRPWSCRPSTGVPFPDRPEGEADPWHAIVDTTRIRRELGYRPWYPSVWSARDVGAL